jgi:hypothetical protein
MIAQVSGTRIIKFIHKTQRPRFQRLRMPFTDASGDPQC